MNWWHISAKSHAFVPHPLSISNPVTLPKFAKKWSQSRSAMYKKCFPRISLISRKVKKTWDRRRRSDLASPRGTEIELNLEEENKGASTTETQSLKTFARLRGTFTIPQRQNRMTRATWSLQSVLKRPLPRLFLGRVWSDRTEHLSNIDQVEPRQADLRELQLMTSAKFLDYWPPPPSSAFVELICRVKFSLPPLLRPCPLFHDPPPPPKRTSYLEAP